MRQWWKENRSKHIARFHDIGYRRKCLLRFMMKTIIYVYFALSVTYRNFPLPFMWRNLLAYLAINENAFMCGIHTANQIRIMIFFFLLLLWQRKHMWRASYLPCRSTNYPSGAHLFAKNWIANFDSICGASKNVVTALHNWIRIAQQERKGKKWEQYF